MLTLSSRVSSSPLRSFSLAWMLAKFRSMSGQNVGIGQLVYMKVTTTADPRSDDSERGCPSWSTRFTSGTGSPVFTSSNPADAPALPAGRSAVASGALPTFLTSSRYAADGSTTSRAVMRSPGASPSYSLASWTAYGMVMAAMKPGISSWRIVACFLSAVTDST